MPIIDKVYVIGIYDAIETYDSGICFGQPGLYLPIEGPDGSRLG